MNETFLENGVTAHRGNSGEFPENTFPAIRSAVELGVDWIELDVLATGDDVLVLSHDTSTGRAGDRDLDIGRTAYAELLTVDVAAGFRRERGPAAASAGAPARIPTLVEVLAFLRTQRATRLSIQPKVGVVDEIVSLVRDLGAEEWIGFNDGSLTLMRRVKELNPRFPVFWDRHDYADDGELERDIALAREHGFEALVLRRDTVTAGRVARIRDAGIERLYTDYPAFALNLSGGLLSF